MPVQTGLDPRRSTGFDGVASCGSPKPGDDHALAHVALVLGDVGWSSAAATYLEAEGYRVTSDPSGALVSGDEAVQFDIAVIDLSVRAPTGMSACAAMRARSAAPVLAVARWSDELTVLSAFAVGADQFVRSDVTLRQLVARLRSLLRRFPPRADRTAPDELTNPIVVDEGQRIALVRGTPLALTGQEFEVLRLLARRAGRVVLRNELRDQLPPTTTDRNLDFVIRRLRDKLEVLDTRRRIEVVRGIGFRLHLDDAHLDDAHLDGVHLDGVHLDDVHLDDVHLDGVHRGEAHRGEAQLDAGARLGVRPGLPESVHPLVMAGSDRSLTLPSHDR